MDRAAPKSSMWPRMPSKISATGLDRSSVLAGPAGPDVEELPDPGRACQEAHRPDQEGALGPRGLGQVRELPADLLAGGFVGGEEVPAAEPVVPHPGRVRHAHVESGRRRAPRLVGVMVLPVAAGRGGDRTRTWV